MSNTPIEPLEVYKEAVIKATVRFIDTIDTPPFDMRVPEDAQYVDAITAAATRMAVEARIDELQWSLRQTPDGLTSLGLKRLAALQLELKGLEAK